MNQNTKAVIQKGSYINQRSRIKKLALSGMLAAVTVALSGFSIPIGASRCFPIQHLVNVMAGIFLGPFYGVLTAFCTSLIRNLIGTGSLLAFPGSMIGAFLSALLFQKTGKLLFSCLGEIGGTGIIGALVSYPLAVFFMGKDIAVFFFVVPFLLSTVCGTLMAAALFEIFRRLGLVSHLNRLIKE